jgi:hypothetical protein
MPEGLGDELVACGCPILAVQAMRAASGLVLLVSTLGDIGIASRSGIVRRRLLRDLGGMGRMLDMMGRMGSRL